MQLIAARLDRASSLTRRISEPQAGRRALESEPPSDPVAKEETMAAGGSLKMSPKPLAPTIEPIARGVWLMRGGLPKRTMNVYLLVDDGEVTMFDAGIADMAKPLGEVAERMGGLKRIVLSHSHADHRGAAPKLGAPVLCHPDEVADAEGDGGYHYFDLSRLESPVMRSAYPHLLKLWDGGPVSVAGTLSEGDEVAGFEVLHTPGHCLGHIALWRERDRVLIAGDVLNTQHSLLQFPRGLREPLAVFTPDVEENRRSIRRLGELQPRVVAVGHGPVWTDTAAFVSFCRSV